MGVPDRLETQRLVIRRFMPDDWPDVLEIAIDKESSEGGKYDHAWPTTEEGCRGAAGYFAGSESYRAVCLKDGGKVIGLLALNSVDSDGGLDLGHVFHTGYVGDDVDTEALECIIDAVFREPGIRRVYCQNALEWTVQLAPLKKLGLRIEATGDGTDFFQRDENGDPITFVGCRMGIEKDEWERRGGQAAGQPTRSA